MAAVPESRDSCYGSATSTELDSSAAVAACLGGRLSGTLPGPAPCKGRPQLCPGPVVAWAAPHTPGEPPRPHSCSSPIFLTHLLDSVAVPRGHSCHPASVSLSIKG